jgi:two-component system, chemotaxis family, CheB/CheR fusion protein
MIPPSDTALPADAPPPAPAETAASSRPEASAAAEFFIVGIGASAGGLEAISEVLKRLPESANLALIIVQHLDPHHESILVELLARVALLPVQWVTDNVKVEPGHVFVGPPRMCLSLEAGMLRLREPGAIKSGGDVNHFFNSLAEDAKHRAVGVVLSGNGFDGTIGARQIKGAGGLVFAQDPATAGFSSMPRSAIDAGCVDRVLTPVGIAEELLKLTQSAPALWHRVAAPEEAPPVGPEGDYLATIFRMLLARTGVDFSEYKQTTIKRRLVRQMMLAKFNDVGEYVKHLQRHREEVDRLYESLLINVTEFFRDSDYFDYLREHVLPEIIAHHPENAPLRIWVAGCATGEEAYSIGILVRELLEEKSRMHPVQIFGTDVSDRAIAHARAGVFSANDVANLSPERLKRFFHPKDRGYVIEKAIRDMCVFARQNVAKDSPFSRIDLLSCRNLLIYLSPKLQRKVMPVFHYALNPTGFLVLGSSESVGTHADLFRLVDRRFRIYTRKSSARRPRFEFSVDARDHAPAAAAAKPILAMPDELKEPFYILREADRIILQRHGPNGVLVNEDLEVLQFRGDVSPYLALTAGRASLNVLKMAREGLVSELQSALNEARENGVRAHRSAVSMMQEDGARAVDLDVTPIDAAHSKERFYLVLFAPADRPAKAPAEPSDGKQARGKKNTLSGAEMDQLRQDLQATRNYLQATIEKHEATNQELRAANEEIQSSNEELQSTNEELETAKEELQSTNEELTTVNEELHSRQLELIQVNNDLTNLINSVHLPIIILGHDLRIRRFTPMAEKVLNVIPSDIGRPLSDLNINLSVKDLPQVITEVVESLAMREFEVQDNAGRWYSLRLRPYKTSDNKIDGVVLTLIDVNDMKRTIAELEEARDFARAVIVSAPEAMAVLTSDLRIVAANDAFAQSLRASSDGMVDRPLPEILHDPDARKNLRRALEGILPKNARLKSYEVSMELPGAGTCRFLIDARQITSGTRVYPMILLSIRSFK